MRLGAIFIFLLACASNPVGPDGGQQDAGVDVPALDAGIDRGPTECSAGLTACGVLCVDTQTDPTNCGACARSCVIPNGSAGCAAGACAVGACDVGYEDANGQVEDGCEAEMSACVPGTSCATECGSTGMVTCPDAICMPPAETCNLQDDNCDGACDEVGDCRVGVHRAFGNGGHFYTTTLSEAMSGGHRLEFENFYRLYRNAVPGTVPFHRCLKGNGLRFYTASATCEGGGTLESVLGHIGTSALCAGRPLYRLQRAGNHFYTTSAPERDNAINNLGYIYEGQVGFVW